MIKVRGSRVLVADGDAGGVKVLSAILADEGYEVLPAFSQAEAERILTSGQVEAVITDHRLPGGKNCEVLERTAAAGLGVPVLLLSAADTEPEYFSSASGKPWYFFRKPTDYFQVTQFLFRALVERRTEQELERCREELTWQKLRQQFHCQGKWQRAAAGILDHALAGNRKLLLLGETGTGHGRIARSLHLGWFGESRALTVIDCSGGEMILRHQVEGRSVLEFLSRTPGPAGTLYLRRLDRLRPPERQRLLHWLEQAADVRSGGPLGVVASAGPDFAADLSPGRAAGQLGSFFGDSCFSLPALRRRKEEIPMLATGCLEPDGKTLSAGTLQALLEYDWPGNDAQLCQAILGAAARCSGTTIEVNHLPEEVRGDAARRFRLESLRDLETRTIRSVLDRCCGNKSQAAKILGLSRKTLYKRLRDVYP